MNIRKPHVVKFQNGKFGIRRANTFLGWQFKSDPWEYFLGCSLPELDRDQPWVWGRLGHDAYIYDKEDAENGMILLGYGTQSPRPIDYGTPVEPCEPNNSGEDTI